jgi:hypothetical protein
MKQGSAKPENNAPPLTQHAAGGRVRLMFTVPSEGAVAPRPFVRRYRAARLFAAFSLFLLACPRPAVAQNSPPAMLERILAPVSVSEFFTYADLPQAPRVSHHPRT